MEIGLYFPYLLFEGMPNMLDGVQIRAVRLPVNRPDSVLFEPLWFAALDVN
jgi:hypothetical protein